MDSSQTWWQRPLPPMDLSWMDQALCREVGAEMFFPETEDRDLWMKAKTVCANCDVQTECLNYALIQPQISGVFGGTTPGERYAINRKARKRA